VAKFDLKAYARQGAASRVTELNAELAAIYRAFPELRSGSPRASTAGAIARKRKRRGMSAAQKAEVSKRMKAYWAAKRATNAR
jgi:hypothetical protein